MLCATILLIEGWHACEATGSPSLADERSPTATSSVTASSNESEAKTESESEEQQQARVANERFLLMLKKQPRPGTALDRVYAFYQDQGTLEEFLTEQRALINADDVHGIACLLVGLIETKRGNHAEAEQAFQLAEQRRPNDAIACWLLGRSLMELQRPDAAALALERAVERTPQKSDLLLVFHDLGRAYRRSRQLEKANVTWQRMESQFPDDLRVKEQIASIFLEEGDLEAALVRYEQLAGLHRDLYQKTQYAVAAADLKLQLGRRLEALSDFETQLRTLDSESWLARDIRRRIGQSFLRNNDQAGLITYYETWLKNHPDDLDVMSSLGHALALQGRALDALHWHRKAVEKAPSNVVLRKDLLALLTREKSFDEASAEYEELQQLDPGNRQHLEDWGLMILHRDDQPLAERRVNAVAIWKRILQDRSDDPGTLVRLAELIQRTEQHDEVLSLYRRAVELRPADPQYREYLGDYLQTLGRTDEAIQVWEAIAEGEERNAPNLIRLADIFRAAGLQDKAIAAMQAACELTPEFNDRLKLARWLREYERDGRYPKAVEALKQLDIAESLAESDEERNLILTERIQCLMAAGQLDQAIHELRLRLQDNEVASEPTVGADQANEMAAEWTKLAAYFEAAKRLSDATNAAQKATTLSPESVCSWSVAARLFEQSGRYEDALISRQKLISLDLRARTQHLQSIAVLNQRLGRRADAIKTGRELLAAGPENPAFIRFYADLCFHFGEREEGLKTLRRSVASSAADNGLILTLARMLANQNETDEATSLCWTAFEKSENLEEKTSTVMMLAEFALRANRFDQLVEKLEQHGRVSGQEQDSAQCLASAYRVAGDLRSARESLENLLVSDSRDSQLLLQLSRLAEEDGDLEAASDYQWRANSISASNEGESRLASLLVRLGDLSEAEALWTRIGSDTAAPADIVRAIDQLIALESIDSAREICERVLRQNPDHWEVLLRQGILEWRYGQRELADSFFRRVLELDLNVNTLSATMAEYDSHTQAGPHGLSLRPPTLERLEFVSALAEVFREKSPSSWFGPSSPPAVPRDYGAARIVAFIGRYLAARETGSEAAVLEQLQSDASRGALRAACDQLGLELFIAERSADNLFASSDFARFFRAAETGDVEAQAIYLELIARRINVWDEGDELQSSIDDLSTRFLSAAEFQLVLKSLKSVLAEHPQWLSTFDAARLICICRHQQRLDELDSLVTQFTLADQPGPTLAMGLDLELLSGTPDVKSALTRLTQLANIHRSPLNSVPATSNSSPDESFEDPTDRLLRIARLKPSETGISPPLQVLDWWLQWRHERFGVNAGKENSQAEQKAARRVIESVVRVRATLASGFLDAAEQDALDVASQLGIGNHFSTEECEFLTQLLVLLHQQNLEPQWNEWCNKRQQSSSANERQESELLQALFWNIVENQEQVLLHIVRAADHAPDDDLLKLALAQRLAELNMKAESLEVFGQLSDRDPVMLKCREFMICELATELQQPDEAKAALTRLAGMELDDAEQLFVVQRLGRFGLEDLRTQLEARRTKVAIPGTDNSPLALLDQYEQQGNREAAIQVAQQLLRRSHQNPTPWRNTTRPTPEQIYARAYKVLRETGELEKMIERQKAQLAKSPHSGRLQKTLLDYLTAAGRSAEADKLRSSWQRIEPGLSAQTMIAQAEELIRAKQPQMACDRILAVIHKHPGELWRETTNKQVFGVFVETDRLPELADAILHADRGRSNSFAPTETLDELIKLLLKDPQNHAKAAAMIQRYSEMYPAYTVSFLKLVENLPLWTSSDELFALLTRMYVPSTAQQLQRPQLAWPLEYEYRRVQLGFDQTAVLGGGNLKRLWDALKFSDQRRLELEQSARDTMAAIPEWPAGPVILMVCALSVPDKTLDQDRIEALVNELCEDSKPAIPEPVAFNLTQLLRQRGERLKRAAVKLLETSLQSIPEKQRNIGQPAGYTLQQLYEELHETTRGLEFLQRSVLESPTIDLDDQDCDAREYSARLAGGYSFPIFGRPVAGLRCLEALHGITAEEERRLGGRAGNVEELRTTAISKIMPQQILEELRLAARDESDKPMTAIHLKISVETATEPGDHRPECALIDSLLANPNSDLKAIRELSDELATSLRRKHPDLSLIVLGTAMVLKSNDQESIDKVLPALEEYVNQGGRTDVLPAETPSDYRRRQDALISLAALASVHPEAETSVTMTRLTEQSLACARTKGDRDVVIAILSQLRKLHFAQGNQSAAEQIQKELQGEQSSSTTPAQPKDSHTRIDRAQLAEQLRTELKKSLLKPSP